MVRQKNKRDYTFSVNPRKFGIIVVDSTLYFVHLILDENVTEKKPKRKTKTKTSWIYSPDWLVIFPAAFFELHTLEQECMMHPIQNVS
jgi:hypothetical protein